MNVGKYTTGSFDIKLTFIYYKSHSLLSLACYNIHIDLQCNAHVQYVRVHRNSVMLKSFYENDTIIILDILSYIKHI